MSVTSSPPAVVIRSFQPGDESAFRAINEAWITRHFTLEPKDEEVLSDPQGRILDHGGEIFMAFTNGRAVGCCALIPIAPGEYEVAKMSVLEDQRGQGTGRQLLSAVVAWASERGVHRLYLETNHQLKPAIHLYRALGFRDLPPEHVTPSPYARADVYMELRLQAPSDALTPPVGTSPSRPQDASRDQQPPETNPHSLTGSAAPCCS